MKNNELLPCPLCGGKAALDRHEIFCDYCGLELKIPTYSEDRNWGYPNYKEARQEMIDLWNTRVGAGDV